MAKKYRQLIRARKWTLDELRRELAELEGLRLDLEARIRKIETDLVEEQLIAARNGTLGDYGVYAQAAKARRDAITQSLNELAARIERKRNEVAEAFQDMKTIEIAADRAAERERKEQQKREQAMLDDLAINRHMRDGMNS